MRILLSGATGFVGRHLLLELSREGFSVRAALRSSDQRSTITTETVVVGSVSSGTDWRAALKNVPVVVHCAGLAHTDDSIGREPFLETNTRATGNFAAQAAEAGAKHFIYLSSILACADSSASAINESDECSPGSHYAKSKLEAERLLKEVCSGTSLNWTVLRPVLIYGPGVKANLAKLVSLVDKGVPLPFGSIHNKRSLLYVPNLVSAIVACIKDERSSNQIFNVADSEVLSTPEIARAIASALGKPPHLVPVPQGLLNAGVLGVDRISKLVGSERRFKPALDKLFASLYVDTAKIRSTLNWSPPYTTHEGIDRWLKEDR